MNKIIIFVIVIIGLLIGAGFLVISYGTDIDIDIPFIDDSWEWEIKPKTWNYINFTRDQLACCSSNKIEDVFKENLDESLGLWVFQEQDGNYKSWGAGEPWNTLRYIKSGPPPVQIFCDIGFTLKIDKC